VLLRRLVEVVVLEVVLEQTLPLAVPLVLEPLDRDMTVELALRIGLEVAEAQVPMAELVAAVTLEVAERVLHRL